MRTLPTTALRRLVRPVLALIVLVVLLGIAAPFVNAAAWSEHIRRALEDSLGRKVSFSAVHFTLFSGPGFSLSDVSIQEDPRFGLEPFAYVPTLQARLRVDKLLRGRIAFSSLRLIEPSLNIVKRSNGAWNIVELVSRLTAPSRLPFDLFPAFSFSDGRVDFKVGLKKTTLYVINTDVSIYPQRSGKLYVQFSGSPARSDRAHNGFGHFRGTINWYTRLASATSNQMEADITLDPSDLSELTTLVEGQDVGVHGTVRSHARIEGPATALRVTGDLHLSDVHRWDLMPSVGGDLQTAYGGSIDLSGRSLSLQTVANRSGAVVPVALRLQMTDFIAHPIWTVFAGFNAAPASELLPLAKRMGVPVPSGLILNGTVDGAVSYSNVGGTAGSVQLENVAAVLPNLPPLRAGVMVAQIDSDRIHFEPAKIETDAPGTMEVGGEYNSTTHSLFVTVRPLDFPIAALKNSAADWFGTPPALQMLQNGTLTGEMDYERDDTIAPSWSGDLRFSRATSQPAGFAEPLTQASGHVRFAGNVIDLDQLSATLGNTRFAGAYHLNPAAATPERLHVDMEAADLRDIEATLKPTLQASGLFARLVGRRQIPAWMLNRRLQGDLSIRQFSINGVNVGSVKTGLTWEGSNITFPDFELKLTDGVLGASGALDVAANQPKYTFKGAVSGYTWRGGLLNAEGTLQTEGIGVDALDNLRIQGTFSGQDVDFAEESEFSKVAGAFDFSFADGWPDLKLSHLEASDGDETWTGNGESQSDGKLFINLEHDGHQRQVVSKLQSESASMSMLGPRSAIFR